MTTDDLIIYIQNQLKKNVSKDLIVYRLSQIGWHQDDIEEGFQKVSVTNNNTVSSFVRAPLSSSPSSLYSSTLGDQKDEAIKEAEERPSFISSYYRPYNIKSESEIKSEEKKIEPIIINQQFKAEEIIANKPFINANEIYGAENFVELNQENPLDKNVNQPVEKNNLNNFSPIADKKFDDVIEIKNSGFKEEKDLPIQSPSISKSTDVTESKIWTPMRVYPIETVKETSENIQSGLDGKVNDEVGVRSEIKESVFQATSSSMSDREIESPTKKEVVLEDLLPKLIEKKSVSSVDPIVNISNGLRSDSIKPIPIPKKEYQPITPITTVPLYVEPVVTSIPPIKSAPIKPTSIPIPRVPETLKKEYQPTTPKITVPLYVEPIKTSTREAKNSRMEAIKIPTPRAQETTPKEYQPITPKIAQVSNQVSYVEPITTITKEVKSAPIEQISIPTSRVPETPKKDNQAINQNIISGTPVINPRLINDMAKRENQKGFIDLSQARELSAINLEPKNSTFNKMNSEINQEKSVDLPKKAMIASYSEDYLSANLIKEKTIQKERAKIPKSLIIIIIVAILLGALTFGLLGGYLKIPDINFSFIRKDPKVLLLKSGGMMAEVKSYKVETEVNISLSSLSNITASLLNGENMGSRERDDVSISVKGQVNKNDRYQSDYISTIKSSILKDGITVEYKKDNDISFATVSDFSKVFGDNIPNLGMIKLSKDKINLLSPKLPLGLGDEARDMEVYQSILGGILEENKQEISKAFGEFISEVKFSKKGEEIIHGNNTYHYIISADKAESKKLFRQLVDIILKDAPSDSKIVLDNLIGSINIDTFDIWIGKDDNNIHQYKVTLKIPLSKVINYENKGISNSQIIFDLQSTFYDFDLDNKITMPTNAIDIDQFLNIVEDSQVKEGALLFKKNARSLYNAEGSFGKTSNKNGLCDQPPSGSLFSPLGHSTGGNTAVGEIAQNMKNILAVTHNTGICYSSPSAWAMALPLSEQPGQYYCLDNTDESPKIIASLLMGNVCPIN